MENTLAKIQKLINVPKGQYNSFGKYPYRSCEDIVDAAKPVLEPLGFSLILSDEVVNIGTRYYVKATATIQNKDEKYSAVGYAREAETKKGMDESQITGSSSSYARKYALNGLFAIDDTKDADTQKPTQDTNDMQPQQKQPQPTAPTQQPTATFGDRLYTCPTCHNNASIMSGISPKTGKPYKGLKCSADKTHMFWSNSVEYKQVVGE